MNILIENAWAQGGGGGGGGMELLVMVGIFFLIMYFMIIRPQNKRNRDHKQLLASLSCGDEVVTSGGLFGKISRVDESFISLEVQSGVIVKVQKQAISSIMPKGMSDEKPPKGMSDEKPPKGMSDEEPKKKDARK